MNPTQVRLRGLHAARGAEGAQNLLELKNEMVECKGSIPFWIATPEAGTAHPLCPSFILSF